MSQEFEPKQQDNIAADVDEVMRKYDRESNTRIWTGWQQIVVKILMVAFALYCIGMTLYGGTVVEVFADIDYALFQGDGGDPTAAVYGLYRHCRFSELPGQQKARPAEPHAVV